MIKALAACLLLLVSLSAQADGCTLPAAGAGEPYVTLAGLSKRQFYLLLNEYMFVNDWKQHAQAVAAGFRPGSRVYGQVLKAKGRFDPKATAAWRRAYTKSGRAQFQAELGETIDLARIDRSVVDWILGHCLGSRLWSEVQVINECRFVFAAGVVPDQSDAPSVQPVGFEVRGGRCSRWPSRPLSATGDKVQCVRSGSSTVSVELTTAESGAVREVLAALPQQQLPPEPVRTQQPSEPASEVVSLWRSRDYRLQQLGRGCPSCGLYAADLRPSVPGAVILRADTVSSNGAGWLRCPAGFQCGVYEFSPADNPGASGCAEVFACRVWRLAETEGEASDVIQLTYQTPQSQCTNCPEGVDFETAHKQWEEARDAMPSRCEVFADLPAQVIGPVPRK